MDYENVGLKIPTRAEVLEKRRSENEDGFILPLPHTGGSARVRLLSIHDRATIGRLPQAVQKAVSDELNRGINPNNGRVDKRDFMTMMTETMQITDAFCVLGFIQPRLVATREEVDENDPYCMFVGDLHPEERQAFFAQVMHVEGVQAKRLEPFRN